MQKRTHSIIEAVTNTSVGLVINIIAQRFVFPVFDINITVAENFLIASIFTVISIIRGYLIRRFFTKRT